MADVLDLRAGRCHDGGVGNRRAVVAADSTCEARGNADDEKFAVSREDGRDDRNQDPESAPGGAGCKGKDDRNHKDNGREQAVEPGRGADHQIMHKLRSAKRGRHGFKRGRQHQDENGRHHRHKALRDAVRHLLEGDGTADEEVDKREDKRNHAAPGKRDERIRIAEGGDQVACILRPDPGCFTVEAAGIQHGKEDGYDQHHNGKNKIDDFSFRVLLSPVITAIECAEIPVEARALFGKRHGAVIEAHGHKSQDEHKC